MAEWVWFLDKVLPTLVANAIIFVGGYVKLYFDTTWPFWGRTEKDRLQ